MHIVIILVESEAVPLFKPPKRRDIRIDEDAAGPNITINM